MTTRMPSTTEKNNYLRPYIGDFKLDHFIVLICAVAILIVAGLFIIWNLIRKAKFPERPSCAGYVLVINDVNATRTGNGIDDENQREQPGVVQLSLHTVRTEDKTQV